MELNEAGIPCSLNHIAQVMAENGLKARNGKQYKYFAAATALSHFSDNLLGRDFEASRPNEKWVSDIACIKIDRGVQYRSSEYQSKLLEAGIRPSMSRKGNCWDNAAMEAFFARMNVKSIYAVKPAKKEEAYGEVFEYIELLFNNIRRHSANGYRSPRKYEQDHTGTARHVRH